MRKSLETLLRGVIDYAGLFPPAKLPLDQALLNYLRYRTEPESWMLGRFICPAARLEELSAFRDRIAALTSPLAVSALGRAGKDAVEFLAGVRSDLADIRRARDQFADKIVVDVYETRLPTALFDAKQAHQLHALIGTTAFLIETHGPPAMTPFFEPPSSQRSAVQATLDLLAADRASSEASRRRRCRLPGGKIRTGGLEAAAVPSPDQLAFALTHAQQRRVPLKFTAGLHHPLRRFDTGLQAAMYGFVNVFLAAAIVSASDPAVDIVQRILEEETAGNFVFDDEAIRWMDHRATTEQIAGARLNFATSFGSCSFDEPREDLRALGWLA